MPHRDRADRLAYLRAWKECNRPSPQPEEQTTDGLPPRGRIVFSDDGETVQCHACGEWLASLNSHMRLHGLDAASYKETYGLKRTASLWPPALAEKQRQAAIERGQGEIGRDFLPRGATRPKGLKNRLAVRVEASEARKGIHTRGGGKTRRQ